MVIFSKDPSCVINCIHVHCTVQLAVGGRDDNACVNVHNIGPSWSLYIFDVHVSQTIVIRFRYK